MVPPIHHRKAWTLWKEGYALHLNRISRVWFITSCWNNYCGFINVN